MLPVAPSGPLGLLSLYNKGDRFCFDMLALVRIFGSQGLTRLGRRLLLKLCYAFCRGKVLFGDLDHRLFETLCCAMAVLLRVLLSVLTVVCVPAMRSAD